MSMKQRMMSMKQGIVGKMASRKREIVYLRAKQKELKAELKDEININKERLSIKLDET